MSEHSVFPNDLVFGKSRNGIVKFAVVEQVGGMDDSEESSDSEFEDLATTPLDKGFIRVTWYPDGKDEVVKESQLQVVDRSCLPRDVVRIRNGYQLGTAIKTKVMGDIGVVGTTKILKKVNVSEFLPIVAFQDDDMVSYGPWLGRVQLVLQKLQLKFSNGGRGKLDLENIDDEDLISDVYPHPSDEGDFNLSPYYPGQFVRAPSKVFKNVQWISGDEIKFKPKTQYRALVTHVEIYGVQVKWGTRAFPEDYKEKVEVNKEKVEEKPVTQEYSIENGSSVDPTPDLQHGVNHRNVAETTSSAVIGTSVDKIPEKKEEEELKNPAEPPPALITKDELKKIYLLNHFWEGHVWLGERFRYQLNEEQAEDLNQQVNKNIKKTKRMRMAKRMEQKLLHSTSKSSLSPSLTRNSRKRRTQASASQHDDSSSNDDETDNSSYEDEDEQDENDENDESAIAPSGGSCASMTKEVENEIEVLVNNESDMTISSPIGQIPKILGVMSCRVAGFELDFTLIQESGPVPKRKFHCNIQNPECSKEIIERVSEKFQSFMKGMLKRNKDLLNDSGSCATMMSQCPQAIRTFIMQQSSSNNQEIYFEYTTGDKHTSGMVDKDGKKTEVEFDDEIDLRTMPRDIQMISDVLDSVVAQPGDFVLTSGPVGIKQCGPNVKYHAGQWVTIEVCRTYTTVDVQWQDGTIDCDVKSLDLLPAHHVDDNDFCPGDFVIDKRVEEEPANHGIVIKADSQNRMIKIQWIKHGNVSEIEEVSAYEVADHPELQFRISDIVVRVSNIHGDGTTDSLDKEHTVGELLRINEMGLLEVLWSNGSICNVHPRDVLAFNDEDEDGIFASLGSGDDFMGSDASWMTASSDSDDDDDDLSVSSRDSDSAGDGDHPKAITNDNSNSQDANHQSGEGFNHVHGNDEQHEIHDENHETGHENDDDKIEKIVNGSADNKEIDTSDPKLNGEIGEGVVISTGNENETVKSEIAGISGEQDTTTLNLGEDNKDNKLKNMEDGLLFIDENHNSENAKEIQENELNIIQEVSVTATISSESISSNNTTVISENSDMISSFSVESSAPESHHFIKRYFDDSSSKIFIKAIQRDLKLLRTSLSSGITVKAYEDRMDLLSVLIEGPERTPYEDGIFSFDIHLPNNYPDSPPSVHYISFSPRLNPNLYETGRVCVSLLGTWSGKGSERWTKDSTILQVLLSIQGLILNGEPYYNEAGYEGHRGTAEGMKNSRCYNEMVMLRLVQHMTAVVQNPPDAFEKEVNAFCTEHISQLLKRVRKLLDDVESSEMESDETIAAVSDVNGVENNDAQSGTSIGFPLLPLSKGVMLSLKSRLIDLENAAKVMGHL
ncbi:(E3-independent) E2 ubiquitin-conjugating enzyme UBE2O-like [Styela clava]